MPEVVAIECVKQSNGSTKMVDKDLRDGLSAAELFANHDGLTYR